ncbi:mannose-1-phosphate guanylyltransferase/mannose-6-phosphate isomerase [Cupriavidus numazuensis]|uniref:mannose-1-phosphate guanylyltransferase n=1 Tax=Cupriavidus numazuensis TaxID=221992 RepID=A0ABM8TDB7_9BURK|nr:mannose-1-phosphate guanylyltransferase/mannose-6-phosphate isomerase [Cupriavidus numazuensis]CAG2135801.1 Alginate biosynthesis protein AlgA [Cupriavidus numazuensis]
MDASTVIIPVVLCGGAGTRLWPLSREGYPKQFLRLLGERSLLQDTLLRACSIPGAISPILVSNHAHRFIVAEQVREVGIHDASLILEPHARNTAPAAAAAALHAIAGGQDPLLLLLPADHAIRDTQAFVQAVTSGIQAAQAGSIVTFGIVPTEPATGYGYIKAGSAEAGTTFEVSRFIEKPSRGTAEKYLQEGGYFWNSGMFLFRASSYLDELEAYASPICKSVQAAVSRGQQDLDFFRLHAESFSRCPSDSIDYAVMEHTQRARVVPMDAQWSDVGSWDSVWKASDKTENGNVAVGDVLIHETKDSLVHASHRLVAVAGLDGVMVLETADAVLVLNRDKAQDVKALVERVRKDERNEFAEHRKVYRPWGAFDSVDSGDRYQVKRITVKPGAKLSLQMHHHRAEHWIVVSGTARVRKGDEEYLLTENQSTYIPIGEMHSLENPGCIPLELIEVQSGAYLKEDDIVRFADSYGRL